MWRPEPGVGRRIYLHLESIITSLPRCGIPFNTLFILCKIPPEINLVRSHKPQTEIKANSEPMATLKDGTTNTTRSQAESMALILMRACLEIICRGNRGRCDSH